MDLTRMSEYIKTCSSQLGEMKTWRVLVRNNQVNNQKLFTNSKYNFGDGLITGICTNRTRVGIPDQDDHVYNLKNYHLISGPKDEFIDFDILDEGTLYLSTALEETKSIKEKLHAQNSNIKEWVENYPSPTLVRQKYRPINKPLLIIYPLNPAMANIYDSNGNLKENIDQYNIDDTPFIAFAVVFPNSNNSKGVQYKVNEVRDLMETEINFESENDNTYPDE